jgi:acetyl-CoA carboxylase biotin carboxyl carrier protein
MADELIEKIRMIVEIVKSNHLKSVSITDGEFSCQIERMGETICQKPSEESYHQDHKLIPEDTPTIPDQYIYIKAPLVGTFYRSSSPNTDPFVEIGDTVDPRQTLCIIEAMKVMNEIASETRGKVIEIYPENGQIVDFNHVLFKIEPISEDESL